MYMSTPSTTASRAMMTSASMMMRCLATICSVLACSMMGSERDDSIIRSGAPHSTAAASAAVRYE